MINKQSNIQQLSNQNNQSNNQNNEIDNINDNIFREIMLKKANNQTNIDSQVFHPDEITNNIIANLPSEYRIFEINNIEISQQPHDNKYYFQQIKEDNSKVFFTMSMMKNDIDQTTSKYKDIKILSTKKYMIDHKEHQPMVIECNNPNPNQEEWRKFPTSRWKIYNYEIGFIIDLMDKPLTTITQKQDAQNIINLSIIRQMNDLQDKQQLHKKLLILLMVLILLLLICIVYINFYKKPKIIYNAIKLSTNKENQNNDIGINNTNDND